MTIRPYFLEDESWYKIKENGEVELTENAPEEARVSFEQYQKNQYPQLNQEANWLNDMMTEEEEKKFTLKNLYRI